MAKTYTMPTVPDGHDVADLVPEDAKANELTATTIVLCVNRGRKVLTDKYDGRDFVVPPGRFRAPYGAAQHFQRRAMVPGTKNLELGGYQSWIGIIGIDDGALCEPFTDAELERFGEAVEAIDRSAFADPADRDVSVVRTSTARAGLPGQGLVGGNGPRGVVHDASVQATPGAKDAAAHIMDRPDESAAAADTAAALADGWVPPPDDGRSQSVDPTPGGRRRR